MNYTSWFSDESAADIALVGGKGANLSLLVAEGFPVPPGFCITVDAYRYLLSVTGLNRVIDNLANEIDFHNQEDIASKSAAVRDLIEQQPIPDEIAAEIMEKYSALGRQMGCRHLAATPVAVRSSATAEDLPGASFAGQQDTYLNIRGGLSLLEHVRRCWASLWTARALTYRWRQGFDHQKVYVAVVVQAMVNPGVSGILFTANPINGRRDECVINASWGLGEAIVSGIVNPDTLVVNKANGRIIQQDIATKERRVVFSPHAGAIEEDVPQNLQNQCALHPEQAAQLAALATRIEQYYGSPQDIEWAHEAGNWYILQARPITTLQKSQAITTAGGTFSRAMFVEIFPDGLSPAFLSVVCPLLENMLREAFHQLGFKKLPASQAVRAINNQPYLSINFIEEALQDLDPATHRHLVAKFTNIFAGDEQDQPLTLAQIRMVVHLFRFVRRFRKSIPALLAGYHEEIERINNISVAAISDHDLLERVRHICYQGAGPLLNNDFLLIAAVGVYRTLLQRLLESAYGDRSGEMLNNLLSGVNGNVVKVSNMLIWNLAQQARLEPQVMRTIQHSDPEQALAQLTILPQAQPFLLKLNEILDICGHREQYFDIRFPTWGEDPTPIIAYVRSYLELGGAADPQKRESQLAAQREEATAQVLKTLDRSPLDRLLRRPLLNYLLEQTQWLLRERDTMHYEWTRLFPPVRCIQLEIGHRWQRRNLIDHAEDIFFLTLDEQQNIVASPSPCQDLVRERQAAYEENRAGPWPDIITDGFAVRQHPGIDSVVKEDAATMSGTVGSPGFATGPVRIISGPQDFQRLQPGDILVAPMTNPVWTPLFALAGGIVTEVGGVLSHGAIVAREYGIPAIMSVARATELLAEGEIVMVDGQRGLVIREQTESAQVHKIAQNHTETTHQSIALSLE